MADGFIVFDLDQGIGQITSLVYRPWGVRTLKMKVTTAKGQPAFRLKPKNMRAEDVAAGIIKAPADNSDAFLVSWGGGHEEGPCLKSKDKFKAFEECVPLESGDLSFIFFNVAHLGPELPDDATVTLMAYDAETKAEAATITIALQKPSQMPAADDIMRLVEQDGRYVFNGGSYLPEYDCRWWPSADVPYVQQTENYPLSIVPEGDTLLVKWGDKDEPIAKIIDHTKSVLQTDKVGKYFEVFAFDKWSIVLRSTFSWLDLNVSDGTTVGMIGRHEIPDAERFDMIIRREDGEILLACTDLHWREMWSMTLPKTTLEATLGLGPESKKELAKEQLTAIGGKITNIFKENEDKEVPETVPYNPVEKDIRKRAEREATIRVRAKGTEAHLPMLHNVAKPDKQTAKRLASSDVRRG